MSAAALITDLFFMSRVKGTADVLGVPLHVVRSADDLVSAVSAGADLVIVDLNAAADPVEAVRRCKALAPSPRVIAFLSHVQKELAAAAVSAGADLVLPRSKFTTDLPQLLKEYAVRHSAS